MLIHGDVILLLLDSVSVSGGELLEKEQRVEDCEHCAGDEKHQTVADEKASLVLHQVAAPASLHLRNTMDRTVSTH